MTRGKQRHTSEWWMTLRRYLIFFLVMAFVISCCIILFFNQLSTSIGIVFERADIEIAAKLTFLNVIFLSMLCTFIDVVRRKLMVDLPVKRIIEAADKIMQGDFSIRIPKFRFLDKHNGFNVIADYFNEMAEELSGIETLRTDFIANVSHELKTPLSVIQNYGTMLQQKNLEEAKRVAYASIVTDASQRLANLVTNILKLNKLENQQIYPKAEVYDLGEQLRSCMLGFEKVWEEKQIDIETGVDDNVLVDADAELLELVWNNLLSNAFKFTAPGGKVALSLYTEADCAVVEVRDTGCGIASETGKHIFEKFYQGDTSHVAQGNGLGLALVKRVVDIIGGDIFVSSQLGKGSVFTVKLERKQNDTA